MPRTPKQKLHKFCKFRNMLTANKNLHLNQFDHHEVDLASRFPKNCTSNEEGGLGPEDLDGLQLQVETRLSNVVVRKRQIKEEMNILTNTKLEKYRGMKNNQGYVSDNNKELHTFETRSINSRPDFEYPQRPNDHIKNVPVTKKPINPSKTASLSPTRMFSVVCDLPAGGIENLFYSLNSWNSVVENTESEMTNVKKVTSKKSDAYLKKTLKNTSCGKKRRKRNLSRITGSITENVVHVEKTSPPILQPENLSSEGMYSTRINQFVPNSSLNLQNQMRSGWKTSRKTAVIKRKKSGSVRKRKVAVCTTLQPYKEFTKLEAVEVEEEGLTKHSQLTGPLRTTQSIDGRGGKMREKNLSRTTGSFTEKVVHDEITFPPSLAPENLFSYEKAVEASAGRKETNVCREPSGQSSSLCSMNLQLSSRETSAKGNNIGATAVKRKISASQTSMEEKEATKRDAQEVMTNGAYADPFCMMDPKRLQFALEEKEEAIACIEEKIRQIVKLKENVQEKEKDCLDEMRLAEEMIHFSE